MRVYEALRLLLGDLLERVAQLSKQHELVVQKAGTGLRRQVGRCGSFGDQRLGGRVIQVFALLLRRATPAP